MTLSGLIEKLKELRRVHGDIDLYVEAGDGRGTWSAELTVATVKYQAQWYEKNKKWYISLGGAY